MVRRSVNFYEIRPTRAVKDAGWKLDFDALIQHLVSLSAEELMLDLGNETGARYDFAQAYTGQPYSMVVFARAREEGLPLLVRLVSLEPLTLERDTNVAELTHIVFFPNNIIGWERNPYGPSIGAFAAYLMEIAPENLLPSNGRIQIAPLISRETISLVENSKEVRMLTVRIASQLLNSVEAERHLAPRQVLQGMANRYNARDFGFTLGAGSSLTKEAAMGLIRWAIGGANGHRAKVLSARLRLEDDTIVLVNLLKGRIGMDREMSLINPAARSVDHRAAWAEVIAAYNQLAPQIADAETIYSPDDEVNE